MSRAVHTTEARKQRKGDRGRMRASNHPQVYIPSEPTPSTTSQLCHNIVYPGLIINYARVLIILGTPSHQKYSTA